ncbi:MAG: PAS domain-containing protein, partial [Desulfovibrionaceae bacterium]|nr:PAS domain-containing protein [Desulfovibrionaceae bacterium]
MANPLHDASCQRNQDYLEGILKAANDGIWDYDLESDSFQYSDRWAEMLGYRQGEVSDFGCFCVDHIHPDDLERFQTAYRDYVEGRSASYEIEFRLRTKGGDYTWIYSRGRALRRNGDGRALRIVGAHTDITARKLVEEKLRESEKRYRDLFETAPVGVFRSSPQGRYLSINP